MKFTSHTQSHLSPSALVLSSTFATFLSSKGNKYHCGSCSVSQSLTSLLSNVHCNKLLVWNKVCGFCYSNNTRTSLGLPSDTLLLFCVLEILWICRTNPSLTLAVYQWGRCWSGTIKIPGSGPKRYLCWSAVSCPATTTLG